MGFFFFYPVASDPVAVFGVAEDGVVSVVSEDDGFGFGAGEFCFNYVTHSRFVFD